MRFFFGTSMANGGGQRKLAGECGSSRVASFGLENANADSRTLVALCGPVNQRRQSDSGSVWFQELRF